MFINITGSLVMGLFVGWLAFRGAGGWTQHGRLFFATGVLGGYTTFSTFSLETILLIERNQIGAALAYVGGSVVIGVLALWGGLALMRSFVVSGASGVATYDDQRGRGGHAARSLVSPPLPRSCRRPISTRSSARARCASRGKRAEISTRLEAGQSVRVPPLNAAAAPAAKRAPVDPRDAEAIRAMILYRGRDVMVLNKPYGLAVQGGSGTKRHIDGMLDALADRRGERPVLVHRLDRDTSGVLLLAKSRKIAAELGADLPLARRPENLLGAGRRRAQAGAGAHLAVPRQGRRRWATSAARSRASAPTSSACASPATASPTRSIR